MAMFPTVRTIISARPTRIVLALVLIALSIWAFAPYVAYHVSSSAFINAEMMRVTAPISGYLSQDLPRKGKFIDHPERLTLIKSYATDRGHLFDLERQQSGAKGQAELAEKQLGEIASLDRELAKRMQAYRDGMIKRVGHEIKEAEAQETGCLAESLQLNDIGARMGKLAELGTTSQIRSAKAQAEKEVAATKCAMAAARLERLKDELTSLKKGVFLRDAANDVPYSQQQRERLVLRRQELETEAQREGARAAQLATVIDEEKRRVDNLGHYNLALPEDHVVWSVPASPGSVVAQGQTILDLADCDNRFVAVEVPEREFEVIKPGSPASVRLIGSDKWWQGTVRQVRGSAARADDRLLAAQVPVPTRGNITVEVSLPREAWPATNSSYCDIGRLADVRFQRGPPVFVESANRLFWAFVDMFRPAQTVARQ